MTTKPNFYQVLHLHPDAPAPMVRTAYRTIMQKLKAHPDLGGDAEHAALVNEAYETLSDAKKRARYDQMLAEHLRAQQAQFSRRAEDRQQSRSSANTRSSQSSNNAGHAHATHQRSTQRQSQQQSSAQKRREGGAQSKAQHFGEQQRQQHQNNGRHCLFCLSVQRSFSEHSRNCETCGCPLNHASELATIEADQENRRGILRLPRSGPVSLFLQREFSNLQSPQDFHNRCAQYTHFATAKDLSPTGMRIASMETLRTDDILRVENQSLIAVASIANHMPTPQQRSSNTYGLQFLAVSLKKAQGGFVSTAV